MDLRDRFQLYLLSKMSGAELVAEALDDLGSSRDEMIVTAAVLAADYALDDVSHPADVYTTLIGEPESERVVSEAEAGEEFRGSRHRVYALPLWPAVRFAVNRHPDGYAWGVAFEERDAAASASADAIAVAEQARPWETTAAALLGRASAVDLVDEWSDSIEALLEFRDAGRRAAWHARFDMRLLQWWRPQR